MSEEQDILDFDIIQLGSKVRITLKPNKDGTSFYCEPVVGILSSQRINVYENGKIEAMIQIAFTETDKKHPDVDVDVFAINEIEKIEFLQEAPESLYEIMANQDKDKFAYEAAEFLLRLFD